jgi:hypothetical protein
MPPWSGGSIVSFGQDHVLSQSEVDTIVQWVDGGAIAGNVKDASLPAYPEKAALHLDGPESSTSQDAVLRQPGGTEPKGRGMKVLVLQDDLLIMRLLQRVIGSV